MAATDALQVFIENIVTFPTALFTGLVMLMALYWLTALIGMVDTDVFDLDVDGLDAAGDISTEHVGFFTGLLLKFGLYGVPLIAIVSIFALLSWVISYIATSMMTPYVAGIPFYVVGVVIFVATVIFSAWVTGKVVSPFRKLSEKRPQKTAKTLLGKVAVVRTSEVNDHFGEVTLEDGGAGLILKVRSAEHIFHKGDRVVLLTYMEDINVYHVISEAEFLHS